MCDTPSKGAIVKRVWMILQALFLVKLIFMFISFTTGKLDSEPMKLKKIKGGIIRMPNNQDNRNRNNNPNQSVNEAGRNGGEATSNNRENEFYEEIGRKGGEARNKQNDFDKKNQEETDGQASSESAGKVAKNTLFEPQPLHFQVKRDTPATKPQKEWLYRLLEQHKITLEVDVEKLTRSEAGRLVDKILAKYGR